MSGRGNHERIDLVRYPIDVVFWAITRRTEITKDLVCACWAVSRATGYRWANDLEQARWRAQNMVIPRAIPTRAPVQKQEARLQ